METLLPPVFLPKTKYPSVFSTFLSETEGPIWKRYGSNIVSTLITGLPGADGPWLRK